MFPNPAPARPALPRWARRTLSISTTLLLIAVSVLALFMVVIPFALGAQSYTVLTGSMRPGLEPGALIAVRPTDPAEIRVGDVITYQLEPGKPAVVTHRVVGLSAGTGAETTFITRGDANNVNDAVPVLPVQVRGVVVYAIPWVGHINLFFQGAQKSMLVIVVGIAAIGYGLVVLTRDAASSRRAKRQRKTPTPVATAAALTLVAAASIGLVLMPAAPAAAAPPTPAPPDALQMSTDGVMWVSDGSLNIFQLAGAQLVPGSSVTTQLWVRNATAEPATFALTASWAAASPANSADIAFARDMAFFFDTVPTVNGEEWVGGELAGGATRTVEVQIALTGASANDTRRGQATLDGAVRLTELVDPNAPEPPVVPPTSSEDLATTGGGAIASGTVLLAAGALVFGTALLLRARRVRRAP